MVVSYYLIHTKGTALIDHIHNAMNHKTKKFPLPSSIFRIGSGEYLCLISPKLKRYLDLSSFPKDLYWIRGITDPMFKREKA